MYARILLAYDGSVKGRAALREGALLAKRLHAEVFLLSVIAEVAGTRVAEGAGGGGVTQQKEAWTAVLNEGVARLRQMGFEPTAKLVVGDPADEIGAFARQIGADLVVVGHHRQSAFARWWSGPSGAYLIDRIDCSLLVSQHEISDEEIAAELSGRGAQYLAPAPEAKPSGPRNGSNGNEESTPGDQQPKPNNSRRQPPEAPTSALRRTRIRRTLFVLLPVALVIGAWWYVTGGQVVTTTNAYVNADKVGISTDVAGIVRTVEVTENQRVRAGQVLYRLDDLPFRLALARAEAQVGTVRDELNALRSNFADAQAQSKQAQYDLDYYVTEYRRVRALLQAHVASQTSFDTARRNLRSARQRLASITHQRAAIAANLNGDPQSPVETNPRYRQAIAQRDEAARELAHTVVRAPFAGIVTNVPSTTPGRYLQVMGTAFYLVATDHVWVDANPKETELTYVRPGQHATVTVDTYPGITWSGMIESISPAAAQAFSLLPPQNTSGNWVKVVQRIPVRVRLDTSDGRQPPLRSGMSVEVGMDTGHPRGWPHALTALFRGSREKR